MPRRMYRLFLSFTVVGLVAGSLGASSAHMLPAMTPALLVAIGEVQSPPRQGSTATTLVDGRVLIAGGDAEGTAEILDPSTGLTTPLQSRMITARSRHGAILLADGNVLIVGGYVGGTDSVEQGAEIFDHATEQFRKIGGTRSARVQPTLTRRPDGIVQISGGDGTGSSEFYDPATGTFGDDPAAASIQTDKRDYAPGEIVTLTGARWTPGEVVAILLHEDAGIHADLELSAVADDTGHITNTDFSPEPHDIGVTFTVTATGSVSGLRATAVFTDAAPASSTYSISTSSGGSLTGGGSDIGNHCDDCVTFVSLPFPVTVYDQTFSGVWVSSNGNVQFNSAFSTFGNSCLPTGFGVSLFPYWDDLRTDTGGGIFAQTSGAAPNRTFTIRWNTTYYSYGGNAQFELRMHESVARFDVVYGPLTGGSATAGIQRSSTGPSTQFGCNFSSVASGTVLTLTGIPVTPTTAVLSATVNPSVFGQPTSFTATVTASGNPVTSGTVTFRDGGLLLGTVALNASGSASFSSSTLAAGTHSISATYNGTLTFGTSSAGLVQTVNKAGTTGDVTANPVTAVAGQSIVLNATVNAVPPGAGTPSGTVQFSVDGNPVGTVALSGGTASATVPTVLAGVHTLSAAYSGSTSFESSSATGSITVNKGASSVSVTSDLNPSTFGQSVVFTATVTPVAPASGAPSGSVQFTDGGLNLGSPVPVVAGTAALTVSNLTATTHSIAAIYSGDSNFDDCAGGSVSQLVSKASASISLVAADLNQTYNGSTHGVGYTTSPAGLSGVSLTYDGSSTPPTNAGTYAVVASLTNDNYQAANATGTLVVAKSTTTLVLSGLLQTYDGSARAITVVTSPAGLSGVSITYDGSPTPPTDAGSYAVVASLTNANYEAHNATGTLVIAKAAATLSLVDLSHTYDGSPKAATASSSPAGLNAISLTYDGSPTPPTNAGSYAVVATLNNANYDAPSATGTLVIAKAAATLALGGLSHIYDGSAKAATATTAPVGLAGVSLTYNGSPSAPTHAGSYAVVASLTNDNYEAPNATGTLVIAKAAAALSLSDLTQTYDGSPKPANASTNPAGLGAVSLTYNGSSTAPTNAGSYAVVASLTNDNYEAPNATGTLVIAKASATLALSNLSQTYNGSPKPATVSTNPAGLTGVSLTYNGSSTVPTNAGTYAVVASLTNDNYESANATGTLIIAKANQVITFSALANKTFGDPDFAVTATSSSGLAVTFSAAQGQCSVTGNSVHITGAGSCTVRASQGGNDNYSSAANVDQAFTIAKASQTIAFGSLANKLVGDAAFTVSATASSGLAVAFSAAGSCTVSGTTVTLTGSNACTITAVQGGNENYLAAPPIPQTFYVLQSWSNVLQPINVDGTSVFKLGSTVPVKFRLTGGSAGLVIEARIYVAKVSNGIAGTELEAIATNAPDAGNVFRYDATADQYIFNLGTKGGMSEGTWQIRIDLLDGAAARTVFLSLKR